MIKAIFFSIFDVNEGSTSALYPILNSTNISLIGPKVLHQVPASSIVPSPSSPQIPFFHFPSISPYIIPRQEYTSHNLTLCNSSHRILSHPITILSPSYPRNAYTFCFSLVLHQDAPFATYLSPVKKLATLFRTLEEQSQFLSRDLSSPNSGKIYALCEILLEDLNNYCESMIPIDASNTLNIKLFPTYPPPPPLLPHHVPLSTVHLDSLVDDNWDLTMLLILPYIDGVNSVRQIAIKADADYRLVKKAIKHLLYYGCVLLLDVFSFSAMYAPTAKIGEFVQDTDVQSECSRYITVPGPHARELSGTTIIKLYCSLKQGQPIRHWYMEHADILEGIDIRRFITFGVIKGFLYRVHKYAIATSRGSKVKAKGEEMGTGDAELKKFLDGTHCFDEICTELGISERELMSRLKSWGDVHVIHR